MEENLSIWEICKKLKLKFWQHPAVIFSFLAFIILLFTLFIASVFIINLQEAIFIILFIIILLSIFGYLIDFSLNRIIEASLMKSELIYIVSHQLRTPLTSLKWTLETIEKKKKIKGGFELAKNNFQAIKDSTITMAKIINSFLDMGRIESGTIILDAKTFSLAKLVRETVSDFQKIAKSKKIKIEIKSKGALPAVEADPMRIAMVVQNLLDNAVRYSSLGEKIVVEIEKKGRNFLQVSVVDFGQGISPENKKFIFKKHYRVSKDGGKNSGGSGIGLYIAKLIVEISTGKIGFVSKAGKGSTFWFTLPIKK